MARRPREHLQCSECDWVGLTRRGALRLGIFAITTIAAALLVGLELLGVLGLGDQAWTLALTILLLSIGARLLVRGDRCRACGAPATYVKRKD